MKKTLLTVCAILITFVLRAQDLSVLIDKTSPAIFKITAYDADGNELQSANGFFYNSNGTGLCNYNVLCGAAKAKVKTKTSSKTNNVMNNSNNTMNNSNNTINNNSIGNIDNNSIHNISKKNNIGGIIRYI